MMNYIYINYSFIYIDKNIIYKYVKAKRRNNQTKIR